MRSGAPLKLLAGGLLLLALVACDPGADPAAIDLAVPVSVATVELGSVEDLIVATGTLRATAVVSLTVETGGILEIASRSDGQTLAEGDQVRAGQVVAEITGEDVRLAARTATTRQRFEAARNDFQAAQRLLEQGLITETELRNAETALAEARLELDRSHHTETRNRLVTPISGVVLRLARDSRGQPMASGQLVAPGLVVAEIAPTGELIADVDLVGVDLARAAVGLAARIRHHAWPDQTFSGRVRRLAPTIDPVTRALRAEIAVDNHERLLRPGMFVEVSMVVEQRPDVPVVPREAVTERGGRRVLFVLRGTQVQRREVSLGLGDDHRVEVRAGAAAGEQVVIRGLQTLADGTRVRVTGSR